MTSNPARIAIVGFGTAGLSCAETLRTEGFDGQICVFSSEDTPPYERPALSKGFLKGAEFSEILLRQPSDLSDLGLDLRLGQRVVSVRSGALSTTDGEHRFDRILLATGLKPRDLQPSLLSGTPSFYTLRDLADAAALRDQLHAGKKIVLIGGGYIGLELAATARGLGCHVTVVEPGETVLARSAPKLLSDWLLAKHRSNGVSFRLGKSVSLISDVGIHTLVKLSDGETLEADCVVVGIGGVPSLPELPESVQRTVTGGVVVDASMRTTCAGLFAAGDIAETWNDTHESRIRPEAWQAAELQGAAAALGMLGKPSAPVGTNWFWTDQYDANIQFLGDLRGYDRVIQRGDPSSDKFVNFFTTRGILTGALFVNSGREVRPTRRAIDQWQTADLGALADVSAPLKQVFAA